MRKSKHRFAQYAAVPAHMRGQLPDLARYSSEHRILTETNLTPDLQIVAARNCHTINRLQAALAMRRQKGIQIHHEYTGND